MSKTKLSSKGQAVIPASIRKRYDLKQGQELEWQPLDAESVVMRKSGAQTKPTWEEWVKSIKGLHKEVWADIDPVEYTRKLRDEPS